MAKDKGTALAKREDAKIAPPRVEEEWERKLREKAQDRRSVETLGIPRVTYQGSILMINGNKVADNRLRIVPIGLVYAKTWYENEWSPGSKDTPGCYAFGEKSDKGLIPHPSVPKKQHDNCDGCPHNAYYTATKGNGKRCNDKRRIVFLLADDLARGQDAKTPEEWDKVVAKAAMYQIDIPPGSLKSWGKFLGSLKGVTPHDDLTEAVIEVTTAPSPTGAFTVECRFLDAVPREAMPSLIKRGEPVFGLVNVPYPVINDEEKVASKPVKGQKGRR